MPMRLLLPRDLGRGRAFRFSRLLRYHGHIVH